MYQVTIAQASTLLLLADGRDESKLEMKLYDQNLQAHKLW